MKFYCCSADGASVLQGSLCTFSIKLSGTSRESDGLYLTPAVNAGDKSFWCRTKWSFCHTQGENLRQLDNVHDLFTKSFQKLSCKFSVKKKKKSNMLLLLHSETNKYKTFYGKLLFDWFKGNNIDDSCILVNSPLMLSKMSLLLSTPDLSCGSASQFQTNSCSGLSVNGNHNFLHSSN